MLVQLTDPHHVLAAQMLEMIRASREREAARAIAEESAIGEEATAAPRPRAWSRLATAHKGPNGNRLVRIFRASAPSI